MSSIIDRLLAELPSWQSVQVGARRIQLDTTGNTCPSEAELGTLSVECQNVQWEDSGGEVRNTEPVRSLIAVQKGEKSEVGEGRTNIQLVRRLLCIVIQFCAGRAMDIASINRASPWSNGPSNRAPEAWRCPPPPNPSATTATSTSPRLRKLTFTRPSRCS